MLTPIDLQQFTGTEQWFRHYLNPKMLYTEGVQHFAEKAGHGAYWFLDIVATEIMPLLEKEPFIVVRAFVDVSQASIKADDGNDNLLWTRHIEYTDCPPGSWTFYLTDNVLMVPSEY
jgi:hypothetical protein